MRAYGQAEDKLGHARTSPEQGNEIGTGLAGLAQPRERMAAGSVQTKAFREIVDAFLGSGTEDDHRGGKLVRDDFGNVVNGLRVQPNGQVPLA